ncbi:MAG: hypothetical protein ACUVUU_09860 [bacterium]
MLKGLIGVAALVVLLIPMVASGWNFNYQIIAEHGILGPSPRYSGLITSGGEGTLEVWFDDSTWPSDPEERFDSLWVWYFANHYTYNPGSSNWAGQILGRFYMNVTDGPSGYVGWCEGTIKAKITVRDLNDNRILEQFEREQEQLFDGRLSKLCEDPSGGEMACKWGWGSLAAPNKFTFTAGEDTLGDGGNLTLLGCSSSVDETSWGSIKALYR